VQLVKLVGKTNAIIPGKEIAGFQLGCSKKKKKKKINGNSYVIEKRVNTTVINFENFSFFISDLNNKVFQITVGHNFDGKFLDKIGIGSTLQDIEDYIGKWEEELDVYILPQFKGICFELSDNGIDDEWIENQMPIEWISIYDFNLKDEIN